MRSAVRLVGAITLAALLGPVVAACSSTTAGSATIASGATLTSETPVPTSAGPSSTATSRSTTSTATSTPATESTGSTASAEAGGDIGLFGQTYQWSDGLEVTVSAPEPFTPSETAAVDEAPAFVRFTITIANNTSATFEPTLFTVGVQSGDREGSQVFDSANGLTGTPSTAVLVGRQSTFEVGFGVQDPADIVMEVTPGFDYAPAFFTTEGNGGVAATGILTPGSPTATADGSDLATFGATYSWDDGLDVTVAPPTPFTPSEFAAAEPAAAYVSLAVTIANRTGQPYDPTIFFVTMQSGDREADQVFDAANGFEGTPTTAILDGRDATFTVGFGVQDPNDLVLQVTPGLDYSPAYFTN